MVFCRGCGKEIHESAVSCPQCGAVQFEGNGSATSFSSYSDVPWYRKNWFAILCFIIPFGIIPLLIILFSGDVYYEKKGTLKTYSKTSKVIIALFLVLIMILNYNTFGGN